MRQVINWLRSYVLRFANLLHPQRSQNQRTAGDIANQPVARIYYSIPGKTFVGLIDRGRILKTGNKGPLTRR
jgi:hypothetical protein